MRLLFIHQNFPGQYRHLAAHMAALPDHQVIGLGDVANIKGRTLPGIRVLGYATPKNGSPQTHPYLRGVEGAVRRGQALVRAGQELKSKGFVPDVICAHAGWGESLYLKDVFPESRLLNFYEFYYRGQGSDVGFDPDIPTDLDDLARVRTRNATHLISLAGTDWGITPTRWQHAQFPDFVRDRISVVFDGIDTARVAPDPSVVLDLPERGLRLTRADEVVTYVARNLEPYRGFHVFMRALPDILARRPNAQVLIVGGDDVSYGRHAPDGKTWRAAMLEEVGSRLDPDRVHFLGKVPYDQFVRILQVSSAHVYLTYPFVLSWSMMEAMAAGCLVIGSATPPVEEVITHGDNGRLVGFFDHAALARAVEEALEDPASAEPLRQRARQTIVERYDLASVCLPRQIALIQALAAGGPMPPPGL